MRQKVVWFIIGVLIGSLFVASAYQNWSRIPQKTPVVSKINNDVPVYFIGDSVQKYFKDARRADVSLGVRTPHILVVESSYARSNPRVKELVKRELLSGIPVIVLGKPEVLEGVFKGQFFAEVVAGKGDEEIEEATVYGYVVYPSNGVFNSTEFASFGSPWEALREAYKWALSHLKPNSGAVKIESLSSGAYWAYKSQLDVTSKDIWKPYGRLNIRTIYYKLINDGSSQYDWYDVHVRQQSVPGKELWNSDWRTADMYTWIDADYYNPNGFLSDYAPTTTSGTTTVSVSIGVSAGEDGAQVSVFQSWSYKIPDVRVYDESDYYQELAKWRHDIAENKAVGSNTYQIEPGATLRFPQNSLHRWKEHYGAKYGKPKWWGLRWDYTDELWIEVYVKMYN
jgi:hypothetical protein